MQTIRNIIRYRPVEADLTLACEAAARAIIDADSPPSPVVAEGFAALLRNRQERL